MSNGNPNLPNNDLPPDEAEPIEHVVIKSESGEAAPPPDLPEVKAEAAENLEPRLERLGGEPAPDITPEEFARLQQAGQIHIDPRGRVRSTNNRAQEADAGVSLRKRRAWYRV